MKRFVTVAAVALVAAGFASPALAGPPEVPDLGCIEFYDPEHAESTFVCPNHYLPFD